MAKRDGDRSRFEEWLTGGETAHLLGVSASRVGQLRRERRLDGRYTTLGYFYHRADVERLLTARAVPITV